METLNTPTKFLKWGKLSSQNTTDILENRQEKANEWSYQKSDNVKAQSLMRF